MIARQEWFFQFYRKLPSYFFYEITHFWKIWKYFVVMLYAVYTFIFKRVTHVWHGIYRYKNTGDIKITIDIKSILEYNMLECWDSLHFTIDTVCCHIGCFIHLIWKISNCYSVWWYCRIHKCYNGKNCHVSNDSVATRFYPN